MPKADGTIEQLFEESRDLHRAIEKVISYGVEQEERLINEIREYVVTPSMESEFEDLLVKMQLAMEQGGPNEVGVWVSGFYGSGKSSFTKYLGLALDDNRQVDGQTFLKHLQDRLKKTTTKQLLAKVAKSYPAAVVFLDLASDMMAGNTMEEISTVLYYKVLEYAGYSRNLKVAALERRLQTDGRLDELKSVVKDEYGVEWETIQNDSLVVDSVIPELAHKMYPDLFKTSTSFSTEASEIVRFETDRVEEMLDIVRDHSGKQHIVFIVDEVGQYVAPSPNLILNLDGLAKNLKSIGDGKVWIFSTAQQTLTEDDPRAALNTPELFKLSARFPIQIDLPASDIKQICYERLLKKSEHGKATLTKLFESQGQSLRTNTKLENATHYSADFDENTFVDLYPFLPSHFEILLQLLGVLAKSTGGIGLRSAIKVIQDILIEGPEGQSPVCEQNVGWIATAVTLFDALEKDIERSSKTVYSAFSRIGLQFPGSTIHANVGKTVAILQILNSIPASRQNVAALMHSSLESPNAINDVSQAADDLIGHAKIPFDDRDGELRFLSERLSEIQAVRGEIPGSAVEIRRIFNQTLKDQFDPLPARKLFDTLNVATGLKRRIGQQEMPLAGDRNIVQTLVEFVRPDEFDAKQTDLIDESRTPGNRSNIFALGKLTDDIDALVLDIYRCEEIARRFKNDPDEEVRDYCNDQGDRSKRLSAKLGGMINKSILEGFFIFRADKTAVDTKGASILEATKAFIGEQVMEQVFDKYEQASVRADTSLAEKFLKIENLASITQQTDPLTLVKSDAGEFRIDTNHPALCSIRDFLNNHGSVDGKSLAARFSADPYGWSQDTVRYLVSAMFRASEIKLKIASRDITALGQQAIEGLRNNNSFKKVVVGLRDNAPDMEKAGRAAERLTKLSGETVHPLEQDISKAALKYFLSVQNDYGALARELEHLDLPGSEELNSTCRLMANSLQNDCSDAVDQLGAVDSAIYSGLTDAVHINKEFENGIGSSISELRKIITGIEALTDSDIPGELKASTKEQIENLQARLAAKDFYLHSTDYSTAVTTLNSAVADHVDAMASLQPLNVKSVQQSIGNLAEWEELTQEEKQETLGQFDAFNINAEPTLDGLNQLVGNQYALSREANKVITRVVDLGKSRISERIQQRREKNADTQWEETLSIPGILTTKDQFDHIKQTLRVAEETATGYKNFKLKIELDDE